MGIAERVGVKMNASSGISSGVAVGWKGNWKCTVVKRITETHRMSTLSSRSHLEISRPKITFRDSTLNINSKLDSETRLGICITEFLKPLE